MAVMSKHPTGTAYVVVETKDGATYRKAFHYRENAVGFVNRKTLCKTFNVIGDSVWQGVASEKGHDFKVVDVNFYD